jgi:TP53 regulating kinase-like protein
MVDATEGMLGIEWIEGKSVRMLLPGGADAEEEVEEVEETDSDVESRAESFDENPLTEYEISQGM